MLSIHQMTTLTLVALIGLAAERSTAAPDRDVASHRVDLRGLDLSIEADARLALVRVTRSAEHLCAREASTFPYRWSRQFRQCVNRAVSEAVAESNSRTMAILFESNRYHNAEIAYAPLPPR